MLPFPDNIARFFRDNHVVSLAIADSDGIWCASCFYVFDEAAARLVVLTSRKTRHGQMMAANPNIAGTIAAQPDSITQIKGIQFTARAECLEQPEARRTALALYTQAHPIAKAYLSDVWALDLQTVKYTDNKLVFAQKTYWQREE
ncbi:pyridoxamine 5'-phosphate oxidase family protein [Neisseria perflava]|uniref:pyridoxamine 5'-phosphate oxidase family protein n=1 Tax=Neisseria perflava TaxID=33053 RepID=UPI0020A0CF7C|nr:pyridoxamine 5'-phosphate oxidase family protein [Neisseria perflava]MCP1661102.1 uncharacterized protein YhbP (UPF0306 family) [Neisseria perflava]MCP1771477.1 uncharacterized protein YhbP (UPF0306 family) [Neisseria perflava]